MARLGIVATRGAAKVVDGADISKSGDGGMGKAPVGAAIRNSGRSSFVDVSGLDVSGRSSFLYQ